MTSSCVSTTPWVAPPCPRRVRDNTNRTTSHPRSEPRPRPTTSSHESGVPSRLRELENVCYEWCKAGMPELNSSTQCPPLISLPLLGVVLLFQKVPLLLLHRRSARVEHLPPPPTHPPHVNAFLFSRIENKPLREDVVFLRPWYKRWS